MVKRKNDSSSLTGMQMISRPTSLGLALTVLSLASCGDSETTRTGREWINDGHTVESKLRPDGSLSIDKRFHPMVQDRYGEYIQMAAHIFKSSHLFNRTPTPFRVYLMFDATDYLKYGGKGLDGLGEFVPAQRAIYLHADGKPLVDRGQNRQLLRELARAVIHDMYEAAYPKWFAVGLAGFLADGALGTDSWEPGVPDPELWEEILKRPEESIYLLLAASDEEFDALGSFGDAFARVVVYVLHELDQTKFYSIVYQAQVRSVAGNAGLRDLIEEFVPNYQKRLRRPVETLSALRPDLQCYLECGLGKASGDLEAKSLANAQAFLTNGSYWYQYAQFRMANGGGEAKTIEALEKSRRGEPHRFLGPCLDTLAGFYSKSGQSKKLREVVMQRMQRSVMFTPQMHRYMAESWVSEDRKKAGAYVAAGLSLPSEGFEDEVALLVKLLASLQD
jgi:hypothetical protein